jgi:nicotinamidase-related amidase
MMKAETARHARPDLKAFVLVDMQCCSLPHAPYGVPNMHDVVKCANVAIAACRVAGIPLIFTRHRQQRSFIMLGGTSVADEFRTKGGVELVPEVDYRPDEDQCFDKQHWSAFRNSDLEDRLTVLPGTQLAIAGTVTDACVQQTAYGAFERQLRVIFIHDAIGACSDVQHMSAMLSMANWVYESRVIGAGGFARWLAGEPFEGWIWSKGYGIPYTLDTLRSDYARLTAPVPVPVSAA